MAQSFQVTGELTDSRHVVLDEPIPLAVGKVQVTVAAVSTKPRPDLVTFERQLRERQQARGHLPPSKDEIDAYLKAERESWDF